MSQCSEKVKLQSPISQTNLNENVNRQTAGSKLDKSRKSSDVNVWEAIQNISNVCNVDYTEAFGFLLDCELNESKAIQEISNVLHCRNVVRKTERKNNSKLDSISSCKTLKFKNVHKSKMGPNLIQSREDKCISNSSSIMLSSGTTASETQLNDFALSSKSAEVMMSEDGDINITIDSTDSSVRNGDSNVCTIGNDKQRAYPSVNHSSIDVNTQGDAYWNGPPAYHQYQFEYAPVMFLSNGYWVYPAQNYYPLYGHGPAIHPSLCTVNGGKSHHHQGISGFANPLYVPCYHPQYNPFPLWAVPRHFPYCVYGPGHVNISGPGS